MNINKNELILIVINIILSYLYLTQIVMFTYLIISFSKICQNPLSPSKPISHSLIVNRLSEHLRKSKLSMPTILLRHLGMVPKSAFLKDPMNLLLFYTLSSGPFKPSAQNSCLKSRKKKWAKMR